MVRYRYQYKWSANKITYYILSVCNLFSVCCMLARFSKNIGAIHGQEEWVPLADLFAIKSSKTYFIMHDS